MLCLDFGLLSLGTNSKNSVIPSLLPLALFCACQCKLGSTIFSIGLSVCPPAGRYEEGTRGGGRAVDVSSFFDTFPTGQVLKIASAKFYQKR